MGCTQPTSTIAPINHIPIERLFATGNATEFKPPPAVIITAEPTPPYIKSVLKKGIPGFKQRTDILSMINSKPPPLDKVVSFDGQVLVRERTPTPKKVWYEKLTNTMPMRKRPRNDDDDYDYDEEEVPSVSSDDDEENLPQRPLIAPLKQLVVPPQWNQPNTFWPYQRTSQGFPSTINDLPENDFNSHDFNENQADYSTIPKGGNIKVRRQLPVYGAPLVSSSSSSSSFSIQPTQPSNLLQLPNLSSQQAQSQPNYHGYNYQPMENIF